MAQQHEAWIVDAFAALGETEVATLHQLLGRVKAHSQTVLPDLPSSSGPSTHLSLETS